MINKINNRFWFCCPECGQKIHPVAPGARGVYVTCKGKACTWSGEIRWDVKPKIPLKPGGGYY